MGLPKNPKRPTTDTTNAPVQRGALVIRVDGIPLQSPVLGGKQASERQHLVHDVEEVLELVHVPSNEEDGLENRHDEQQAWHCLRRVATALANTNCHVEEDTHHRHHKRDELSEARGAGLNSVVAFRDRDVFRDEGQDDIPANRA